MPSEAMDQRWRIELLGGLRAVRGSREITPLRRRKVEPLFAYLAFYHHHPHPREALIELLWPEVNALKLPSRLNSTRHTATPIRVAAVLGTANRVTVHGLEVGLPG